MRRLVRARHPIGISGQELCDIRLLLYITMILRYSELMTLHQLRFLREIARQSLNMSNAAAALYTSQPGVSRQIQLLERELGVALLQRSKNRILGFTEAGKQILNAAQRTLNEAENIKHIASDFRDKGTGRLILATSHLHARYTLLKPVKRFAAEYPNVELHLMQADPDDVASLIESGEADLGVSTDITHDHATLAVLTCAPIKRCLITPKGHPLSRLKRINLRDIAKYPIVGYHRRFRTGQILEKAFAMHGIEARSIVSASDSDVIKAYVAEGVGIAVVPSLAIEEFDSRVCTIDVTSLFPQSHMTVGLRRDLYPRGYLIDFIRLLIPDASREAIQARIEVANRR